MLRATQLIAVCAAMVIGSAAECRAALVVFSDRTTFEAFIGSSTTETFNGFASDTVFTNSLLPFSDFTLTSGFAIDDVLVDVPPYDFGTGLETGGIDGTTFVNLAGLPFFDDSVVGINFLSPVTAVGFDTLNYDANNDSAEIFLNGTLVPVGTFPTLGGTTGFFGIVDTLGQTINSLEIRETNPLSITYNAFDNLTYSAEAIPEPGSLALCVTALSVAFGSARRRRRQRQSAIAAG